MKKTKNTVRFFDTKDMFNLTHDEFIKSLRDGVVIAVATGVYQAVITLKDYMELGFVGFDLTVVLLAFCVSFLGAIANRFANIFRVIK